jgi:hypothetical protein
MREISWLAEWLLASQEGLCSEAMHMDLGGKEQAILCDTANFFFWKRWTTSNKVKLSLCLSTRYTSRASNVRASWTSALAKVSCQFHDPAALCRKLGVSHSPVTEQVSQSLYWMIYTMIQRISLKNTVHVMSMLGHLGHMWRHSVSDVSTYNTDIQKYGVVCCLHEVQLFISVSIIQSTHTTITSYPKVKVNLSPCLITHHVLKTYGGVGVYLHAL